MFKNQLRISSLFMKKLFALSFLGTCILLGVSPIKADYDKYGIEKAEAAVHFDNSGDITESAVTYFVVDKFGHNVFVTGSQSPIWHLNVMTWRIADAIQKPRDEEFSAITPGNQAKVDLFLHKKTYSTFCKT